MLTASTTLFRLSLHTSTRLKPRAANANIAGSQTRRLHAMSKSGSSTSVARLAEEVVFAQILLGFEVAAADSRIVGINLVQPEDCYVCMADYRLHMQMIDALHTFYPNVHISLHAGELEPGMVPPDGLTFHIRSAVEQGHAERIGHGVDVMYEDKPMIC